MFCLQGIYKHILEKLAMETACPKIAIKILRAKGYQGRKAALWLPRSEKEVGLKLDLGRIEEPKERWGGHEEKEPS